MEQFIFRLVDIPPENRKVLAAQIHRFLPLNPSDIVWQVVPVAGRSFIMALHRKAWEEVNARVKSGRRRPIIIPSFIAMLLYHYWHHNGQGTMALPVESGYIMIVMTRGRVEQLELREEIPEEGVTLYDDDTLLACGAALYTLIPHPFSGDLRGHKPFPRLMGRLIAMVLFLLATGGFLAYSVYSRNVDHLSVVTDSLTAIKKETRQVEAIMARNQKIRTTAEFLVQVNEGYISPYLVLGDITAHLPGDTYLIDFYMDAGKGYMTGISRDVTGVLETVSGRPYMGVAEFSAPVVRDKKGNERFQIRFEIKKAVKKKADELNNR
jgi:hypothetical protein